MKILLLVVSFFSFVLNASALKNITIDSETLSPPFNKDIKVYNYYTSKERIKIMVSKNKEEIVKGYGYFNVKEGLNEFKVTADNSIYIIKVFKNYKDETSNALLKDLSIKGYDINFKEDVFTYEVFLKEESYLDIEYELYNYSDKVNIDGNGNFTKDSNVVLITVSNNETKNIYKINVKKTVMAFKENDANKEFTYKEKEIAKIVIVSISCILVFSIYYVLFIKKLI